MIADTLTAALDHLGTRGVSRIVTFVVLGSGLGEVASALLREPVVIPYREIPGMPATFIGGHRGELRVDRQRGLAISLGRTHLYQGIPARDVVYPIRLAAALGARRAVLTNAAGSLVEPITPGSLVVLSDHLNLTGATPLDFAFPITKKPEFVPMIDAYAPALRSIAHDAARQCGVRLHEGVYAGVHGPAYETPAEARTLRALGAHVVGMSTVLETIAARALGLEVLGISLATNHAGTRDTHADVLTAAAQGSATLSQLLERIFIHFDSPLP